MENYGVSIFIQAAIQLNGLSFQNQSLKHVTKETEILVEGNFIYILTKKNVNEAPKSGGFENSKSKLHSLASRTPDIQNKIYV